MFTITYVTPSRKLHSISTPNKGSAYRTFATIRRQYAARLWFKDAQGLCRVF